MLRHERRLLIDCLGIGFALTMLVIAADASGVLEPAENFLYDMRARYCQFFTPPPTDKLIHLDIDDTALDVLGAWPWPRRKMAMIFDELHLAGPKAIEMDVIYSEPQLIQYEPRGDGAYEQIDNDTELALAMERLGNVIVPSTLEPVPIESPEFAAAAEQLRKDPEQDSPTLRKWLTEHGYKFNAENFEEGFLRARREAIMLRFAGLKDAAEMPFAAIKSDLLPHVPDNVHPGVENVVREQWTKFRAMTEFTRRHSLDTPPGMQSLTAMRLQFPPLRQFSESAAGGAFVDYTQYGSAVIRTLPLLLEAKGRVYPQMGLALACRMLDADIHHMRVDGSVLRVPRKAGGPELVIPLAPPRKATNGFVFGNLFDIPYIGGHDWKTSYDWPRHTEIKQHIPLNDIWQSCFAHEKVITNCKLVDDALRQLFATMDQAKLQKYEEQKLAPDDYVGRSSWIKPALDDAGPYMEAFTAVRPEDQDRRDKLFIESYKFLRQMLVEGPRLTDELQKFRSDLKAKLGGKAILLGWTATAAIADFVPTSLHEKCPGPVVHGMIFNGIMTGEMWRRMPWWVATLSAALMGMMTALAVGYLSPMRALPVAAGLALAYMFVNGIVLFDYGNRILGAAGPLAAIGVVWGGCTLTRVVVEATERARITRRFSTYASPRLVDYVLEHPEVRLDGENREMSIVYTDLAGFTTLSEKLGEKIVPVLNELLGELVPIVEDDHHGLINKFLGDGIMFFFNAPEKQEDHASRAVSSVLAMHQRVQEFNPRLRARGLPELSMRAGIACGVVIVGDAGMEGRSDYTVLGDSANLGSRLEAANKQVGTLTLMNDRVRELLNGEFLIRPIGRIKVVGKDEAVMCHEPLARTSEATEQQRELARSTGAMVEAFLVRRFDEAGRCADEMDQKFGPSKLTSIYRGMCQQYLETSAGDDFDGRIVLTEK